MSDHVYRIIQVAGSSQKSIEDAIQNGVGRAARTLRQVGWFEVVETRGHVEDGKVAHYQVTLKVGFTLDDDDRLAAGDGCGTTRAAPSSTIRPRSPKSLARPHARSPRRPRAQHSCLRGLSDRSRLADRG